MKGTTRLLVVDGSELLTWMVTRVAPDGVEVSRASTMSQAEETLTTSPPDAAIFNISPRHAIWRSLIEKCTASQPVIPFLCTAAMNHDEASNCGVPCRPGDFISLDMTPVELAHAVEFLIAESRRGIPDRFRRERTRYGVDQESANAPPTRTA